MPQNTNKDLKLLVKICTSAFFCVCLYVFTILGLLKANYYSKKLFAVVSTVN